MKTLQIMLIIAGLLHLAITSAGITMTMVLDWRKNLSPLCALTRHVIWTHALFVLMTIIAFGAVSLFFAAPLASGAPLAATISFKVLIGNGTCLKPSRWASSDERENEHPSSRGNIEMERIGVKQQDVQSLGLRVEC